MHLLRAIVMLLLLALPAAAQQSAQPVLILDRERLFAETLFGQRVTAELAAQAADLQAENDRIVATLTQEERSLTLRRPEMTPEDFQAEADAFDAKVQDVRRVRDAKNLDLQLADAAARASFEEQVQQIIGGVMAERGAVVVIEERNAILWVRSANITDVLIARVDTELGDGAP